jgi:Uma2 family endonuclease
MSTIAHISLLQYELMVESGAFDGPYRQRVELIRGEILAMNPIGTRHAATVTWLTEWSYEHAPRKEVQIRNQNPLRIPTLDSEPEPDVAWMARKDYSQQHPQPEDVLLLIEVAESSLEFDKTTKALLYAEAGVGDYWVVNLEANCLEVFRDPTPAGYQSRQTLRDAEQIAMVAYPDVKLTAGEVLSLRDQA